MDNEAKRFLEEISKVCKEFDMGFKFYTFIDGEGCLEVENKKTNIGTPILSFRLPKTLDENGIS